MTRDINDGTHTPTHDEAREQLPALALGALDDVERAALVAHVADCVQCGPELAALRATTASLAFASPARDDAARRAAVRERLMARVAAERVAPSAEPAATAAAPVSQATPVTPLRSRESSGRVSTSSGSRAWIVALAASLLVAAATGLWGARAALERNALRAQLAARDDASRDAAGRVVALQAHVAELESTLGSLIGRDVSVMELSAAGSRSAWARMFFDRANRSLTMFAGNFPKPGAGRTYELWVIAAGQKVPAGTFVPDERGEARIHVEYPAAAAAGLQAVAVTDEPEGGVPQPTGTVVVASQLPASR